MEAAPALPPALLEAALEPAPAERSQTALVTADLVVVDCETTGLATSRAELIEVAAVRMRDGRIGESFQTLLRPDRRLPPGIAHFTGITEEMLEAAPAPAEALAELRDFLGDAVFVAHNANFDRGFLAKAFREHGLAWSPPAVLCTLRLATKLLPLQQRKGLSALAALYGLAAEHGHRALPDALTCARVLAEMWPKLLIRASTVEQALELQRSKRERRGAGPAISDAELGRLPTDPGVYVFRDSQRQTLYVGKSKCVRRRARSHFYGRQLPSDDGGSRWIERAATVDYHPTNSELGALVLENRMIKALKPLCNVRLKHFAGHVYLACRFDQPYPRLELTAEPAGGDEVLVGPFKGRRDAAELLEQLNSIFRLRHCGRRLRSRAHPSVYGQMDKCLSPCVAERVDPIAYRALLDSALGLFSGAADGRQALLAHLDEEISSAARQRRYERAAWLLRRRERLQRLLGRLAGLARAVGADDMLLAAAHPLGGRHDLLWVAGGRVRAWRALARPAGALDAVLETCAQVRDQTILADRSALPPGEVDEIHIVASWLAANETPTLPLRDALDRVTLTSFLTDLRQGPGTGG